VCGKDAGFSSEQSLTDQHRLLQGVVRDDRAQDCGENHQADQYFYSSHFEFPF